jgi:hemerythrin
MQVREPRGTRAGNLRRDVEEFEMVSRTRWSSTFSVGIEQIDAQHKTLFGYIADLEKSVDNPDERQRWSAIHYAILQLRDYSRIHFSVEECVMEVLGYPGRIDHVQEHRHFIGFLSDLERRSITHNDITENEIIEFLRNWLLKHIAVSDKEYSRYFSDAGNAIRTSVVSLAGDRE